MPRTCELGSDAAPGIGGGRGTAQAEACGSGGGGIESISGELRYVRPRLGFTRRWAPEHGSIDFGNWVEPGTKARDVESDLIAGGGT